MIRPPRFRVIAGSVEADLLEVLIPAAGRWIDCDALPQRMSIGEGFVPSRHGVRLVRCGVVQVDRTPGGTTRMRMPPEAVELARQMLDDAQPVVRGPRVCVPAEAPRWLVGGPAA